MGRSMYYPKWKTTPLKYDFCCVCGKKLKPSEAYYYVDGNNIAITNNAKAYCVKHKDK